MTTPPAPLLIGEDVEDSLFAHLSAEIPKQLAMHGLPWLSGLPHMSFADVLAQKL
jgi:hypothetical protein